MRTLKIGKSQDNNIVLSNPTVSRNHALLMVDDSAKTAVIRDLNSKNGTFVNERRITADTPVTMGDRLRLGNEMTSLSALLQAASHTVVRQAAPVAPVMGGGGDRQTIGRGSDCQIRYQQDDVSTHHALLYRDAGGQVVIEDTNSTNGTFVNGQRISRQVLKPGDQVTITRAYPLDWQRAMGAPAAPPKPARKGSKGKNSLVSWIASAAAVVVAAIGGFFLWQTMKTETTETIYEKYNTAVCMIYFEYGYKVMFGDNDVTAQVFEQFGVRPGQTVYLKEKNLGIGTKGGTGTGFFVSNDGKVVTNLHVARHWLYENDAETIESAARSILATYNNPQLNAQLNKLKIVPEMAFIGVVPNGVPFSRGNLVECTEYRGHDDIDKDCAILQTESRILPPQVKNIIDYTKADASEEAVKEGKTVFTIGFPYGPSMNINSNNELKNQVHQGVVTQNKGDVAFAHDAATASGASGSPMLNEKGYLVGIHHAGLSGVTGGAQGFNEAIKAKCILDLLK